MLAECIAAGKRLLYPPRENFREETILQQHVHQHVVAEAIPLGDFYRGDWGPYLKTVCDKPAVFTAFEPMVLNFARSTSPSGLLSRRRGPTGYRFDPSTELARRFRDGKKEL